MTDNLNIIDRVDTLNYQCGYILVYILRQNGLNDNDVRPGLIVLNHTQIVHISVTIHVKVVDAFLLRIEQGLKSFQIARLCEQGSHCLQVKIQADVFTHGRSHDGLTGVCRDDTLIGSGRDGYDSGGGYRLRDDSTTSATNESHGRNDNGEKMYVFHTGIMLILCDKGSVCPVDLQIGRTDTDASGLEFEPLTGSDIV